MSFDERQSDAQDRAQAGTLGRKRFSSLEATMSAQHSASTDHNASLDAQGRISPSHSYRELVARGLTDGEAAALTAYLEGLDVAHHTWSLREVNGLLFLRHLHQTNQFGVSDGEPRA